MNHLHHDHPPDTNLHLGTIQHHLLASLVLISFVRHHQAVKRSTIHAYFIDNFLTMHQIALQAVFKIINAYIHIYTFTLCIESCKVSYLVFGYLH